MTRVLTANRLSDGEVVYLGKDGWAERLASARTLSAQSDEDAALGLARLAEEAREIVAPYLVDLGPEGTPLRMREIIRAAGPTVRRDLGKQAS